MINNQEICCFIIDFHPFFFFFYIFCGIFFIHFEKKFYTIGYKYQ